MLLTAIDISETACYRLKKSLGISHIVVSEHCTLSSDVAESQNASVLCNSIKLLCSLNHLMERDG